MSESPAVRKMVIRQHCLTRILYPSRVSITIRVGGITINFMISYSCYRLGNLQLVPLPIQQCWHRNPPTRQKAATPAPPPAPTSLKASQGGLGQCPVLVISVLPGKCLSREPCGVFREEPSWSQRLSLPWREEPGQGEPSGRLEDCTAVRPQLLEARR